MSVTYPVTLDGNVVGSVTTEKAGLYMHFSCRCKLSGRPLVSLYANQEDLGVLVPEGDAFYLTTKVPLKRFPGEKIDFRLVPRQKQQNFKTIPIWEDIPIPCIDRLGDARYLPPPEGPALQFPVTDSHPAAEYCPHPS